MARSESKVPNRETLEARITEAFGKLGNLGVFRSSTGGVLKSIMPRDIEIAPPPELPEITPIGETISEVLCKENDRMAARNDRRALLQVVATVILTVLLTQGMSAFTATIQLARESASVIGVIKLVADALLSLSRAL